MGKTIKQQEISLTFPYGKIAKSQPHLEYTSLLCSYNGLLFDKLERMHSEMILNNHHRKLYGVAVSDNNSP
jgi:hypothetical protein